MKRPFALLSASVFLLLASPAFATPYCEQLLDRSKLEARYQRLAPIYSSVETGWIFPSDQLKSRYDMKPEAVAVMREIIAEFAALNLPLAIVIAPPRPVVAGQDILDAVMGPGGAYDVSRAAISFDGLIEGLQDLGAIAPNLLRVARQDQQLAGPFYFRRDTHWTTSGAVISAAELARHVMAQRPGLFPEATGFSINALPRSGEVKERGSLADIVRATCQQNPVYEFSPEFDFDTDTPGAAGLLGPSTAAGPRIALLGSSFSDRYKRDHYRFADALAAAFHAEVDNLSISGGGMIGAIESFVLLRMHRRQSYDLLLWELPYTNSFNVMSHLRQLLGALQSHSAVSADGEAAPLGSTGSLTLDYASGFPSADLLLVDAHAKKLLELNIRVTFASGKSEKFRLVRSRHIAKDRRSRFWPLSLSGIDVTQIVRIELEYDPRKIGTKASVRLMRAAELARI